MCTLASSYSKNVYQRNINSLWKLFLYFRFFKLRFVFVELFIDEGEGEEDSDDGKLFNSVEWI